MKFYLAPMEGLTGYIFRNAHATYFGPLDKYFTPFIAANTVGKLSSRELNDILPEHNKGIYVVPQILTNKAEDFIRTVETLQSYGYNEVNLNLGCPSGTVVSKNRGSGFLSQRDELDRFLDQVCSQISVKFSIKTRIGKDVPEEFPALMEIFNQYPLEELIIHPRVQKDYYKNKPNLEVFKAANQMSKSPVGYNGDIFTVQDYEDFHQACPNVQTIMLGRGVIANPGLVREVLTKQPMDKTIFKKFHNCVYEGYQEVLSGERNVLFKMKEMWFYMSYMFSDVDKYAKKIRKSQHLKDYEVAVEQLLNDQNLIHGAGLFKNKTI